MFWDRIRRAKKMERNLKEIGITDLRISGYVASAVIPSLNDPELVIIGFEKRLNGDIWYLNVLVRLNTLIQPHLRDGRMRRRWYNATSDTLLITDPATDLNREVLFIQGHSLQVLRDYVQAGYLVYEKLIPMNELQDYILP